MNSYATFTRRQKAAVHVVIALMLVVAAAAAVVVGTLLGSLGTRTAAHADTPADAPEVCSVLCQGSGSGAVGVLGSTGTTPVTVTEP